MSCQYLEPIRARESMNHHHRTQIDQPGGDSGLLRAENNADAEMALLPDNGEEGFGESF